METPAFPVTVHTRKIGTSVNVAFANSIAGDRFGSERAVCASAILPG